MLQGTHVLPDRKYFKIGDAAQLLGVKPHVLRYWETEFNQIKPVKSKSGQRLYRRRDMEYLLEIQRLLYEKKFTIAGARQMLQQLPEFAGTLIPPVIEAHEQVDSVVQTATPEQIVEELRTIDAIMEVQAQPQVDPALLEQVFDKLYQARTDLQAVMAALAPTASLKLEHESKSEHERQPRVEEVRGQV